MYLRGIIESHSIAQLFRYSEISVKWCSDFIQYLY